MLAVLKRDAFKAHIVCAFHDNELRQHGRDDFRFRHVFAGQRQVKHLALRFVEKPLARRIQSGAVVLHPIALIRLELDEGIRRATFDLHRLRGIVQCLDAALAHGPGVRDGDQSIVPMLCRDRLDHVKLLLSDGEGMEVHVLGQIREHSRTHSIRDVKVAFVRRTSTRREASVDPELLKLPRLIWQRCFPESSVRFRPSRDRLTTGKHRLFAHPRHLRVILAECDRLRDRMHAILDDDAHRFGCLAGFVHHFSQVPGPEHDIGSARQWDSRE